MNRHVATFTNWWFAELAGLVPSRVRRRGRRNQLVVELTNTMLVVRRWGTDSLIEIGRVPLAGTAEAEQRAMLQELLGRAKPKHLALLLPRSRGLRKLLSLPAAAEENLHQVLSFEMDRQTPFSAEDVYFDYAVRARRKETGRIDVELVLLPRATVDEAIALCRRLGLTPEVVGIAWDQRQDPNAFNLLPKAHGAEGKRRGRRLAFLLGMVAIGLLAAAVYVPLDRQRQLADELAAEMAAAKEEAEAARGLRAQIDQAIEQGRLIVLKKMENSAVVHVLDEITRLLNDDTWLIRMRIYADEVEIFGYSKSASMLIGAIEQSPLFADVQFRAPVTRDPRVDAERFHIAFRITQPSPQVAGAEPEDVRGARR